MAPVYLNSEEVVSPCRHSPRPRQSVISPLVRHSPRLRVLTPYQTPGPSNDDINSRPKRVLFNV